MASAKNKPTAADKPWNKQMQINLIQGQLDDALDQAATCLRRAKIHIAPAPGREHAIKTPDAWMQEAKEWQSKVDLYRREIAAIQAVPGEWYGPADIEVIVMHITAINTSHHVIAAQETDEGGPKDAAFIKRFVGKKITFKILDEPTATRRHMRYNDTLMSVKAKPAKKPKPKSGRKR